MCGFTGTALLLLGQNILTPLFSLSTLSLSLSHVRTQTLLFRPFSASHRLEARAPRGEVEVRHASPTPARTKT